jgi:hypothetical protein
MAAPRREASYEVSRATKPPAAAAAARAGAGRGPPRVANLIPTAGSRRSKFLSEVKPRTDTGRGTVPPPGTSRPGRLSVNNNGSPRGAGAGAAAGGSGSPRGSPSKRSPGASGSGSPSKRSPGGRSGPDVSAHLASAKARRAASLLQDSNGREVAA